MRETRRETETVFMPRGKRGGRECGEKEERMVNGIFGRGKNMNKEKGPRRSVI